MRRAAAVVGAAMLAAGLAAASDWTTFGADPQRSGWAKKEDTLSTANAAKLKLEWSIHLDNQSIELNSLTAPIVQERVITPSGFKDIVYVAGSQDKVFAVDADSGKLLWSRALSREGEPKQKPHWLCPNSLNATPVIDKRTHTLFVMASDGMLHSLSTVNGEDLKPPQRMVPPYGKAWSLNIFDKRLYTVTSQGCNGVKSAVFAMDLAEPDRPVSTVQVSTAGGGIWGRAGGAISEKTGNIYVETGDGPSDAALGKYANSFVAVDRTSKLVDYYTPTNYKWIDKKDLDMGDISPVVFSLGERELVAGGGKEGVLYLLDAKSLGGADHHTPLYRSPLLANSDVDFAGRGFWGALSSWQDAAGTRWLLAPAWGPATKAAKFPVTYGDAPDGSVMAFRVVERGGAPVLDPAWQSVNMGVPEPVAIANGVVFALSSGESTRQVDSNGQIYNSAQRIQLSTGHAVLYALDAETGKVLFSSGDAMKSFSHFSGISVSNGRVFAVTHDSTLYAFGLGEENP